ncbi:MAG: hypothetical protein VR72_09240 [Clostridiaceae bacterium BRH_c20a]|nr:MAG: hypothetical protein VR72_09240 [Clostridiaceae bacterium BRH_c20a]
MGKRNLKNELAIIFSIVILLTSILPLAALSAPSTSPQPEEPYERVIYKAGSWYSEYMGYDGKRNLIVGYQGSREIIETQASDKQPIKFSLKNNTLLRGVYLPYSYPQENPQLEAVNFFLEDERGNIYGPFTTRPSTVGNIQEASEKQEMPKGFSVETISIDNIYIPEQEIVLKAGSYSLYTNDDTRHVRNNETGLGAAVLIKGIDYSAWQKYKENLLKWVLENDPENSDIRENAISVAGSQDLAGVRLNPGSYEAISVEKPPTKLFSATFTLDDSYQIDEVVFNTFNGGQGAPPGLVSIADNAGKEYGQYQAYGGILGTIPNGLWIAAPGIVLPAGEYILSLPDMSVVAYDNEGYPDFYVSVSPMPPQLFDFTGRYQINLDTIKTSTIMGPVQEGRSSFSLKDFELTVLDKCDTIELIGKYEGMPFSQICEITERDENSLKASFTFAADLTKLPYKAKIGAGGVVTLQKEQGRAAKLDLQGDATFERAASETKGADFNSYQLTASGNMIGKDLPPYVLTALGAKMPSAGNIPGPDGPAQAAAGALFPPLVGVVVHVLETLLKPKPKAKVRDKDWYKDKYPGKTDEELAMIMMADALGNTDEPDDDPFSVGDNEKPGGSDYVSPGSSDGGYEGDYEPEDYNDQTDSSDSDGDVRSDEDSYEKTDKSAEKAPESEQKVPAEPELEPPQPAEPETMVVQTDHKGGTTEYVKDPVTGEWVNPQTGGVFDPEAYEKVVKPGFEKDKEFINSEFEKNTKGETAHDRWVREEELKRQEKLREEEYLIKLGKKHGTSNKEELEEIIGKIQAIDKKIADTWNAAGNLNAGLETGAKAVGAVSDGVIDGMANATGPVGKKIRVIYKVTKGVAGTMAKDGISAKSLASGLAKGGTDAYSDFVKNPAAKALVTVSGEVVGGGISEGWEGAAKGAVDGAVKAGLDAVPDALSKGYGGDLISTAAKGGKVRVAWDVGGKLSGKTVTKEVAEKFVTQKINRQVVHSTIKTAAGLTDEFAIKPGITEPIKEEIGKMF